MSDDNRAQSLTGAVMVVGGGIAGTQAALDLAEAGFYVTIVESSPSLGGAMAQLDKTFPTNDCSMCILSPKLVECGRHRNIRLITMAELEAVEGEAGRFVAVVRERPRYVDAGKCIACGKCAEKCPSKTRDAFNKGLGTRKAAYLMYPQAVPLKFLIDAEHCIYFKKGKCKACEKFCPAGAIDFSQEEKIHRIGVGAIILAPGFEPFDPTVYDTYGYGRHSNVITSMEFERILSPSGPSRGHLVRPSDQQPCRRIAWLQCIGSRDLHQTAHGYCSGVCCAYAVKQAVIAKEHAKGDLAASIFFMDMRTYGKDFENYYARARDEGCVRFIRSRVHSLQTAAPGSQDLRVDYVDETGGMRSDVFDLVVLSVGLEPSRKAGELAQKLNIQLNPDGFAEVGSFRPVETSRSGIFVCGVFSSPKDIPSSVTEASAASAASAALLSACRNSLTIEKAYPPEDPIIYDQPRIGVFICHCGMNIAGVIDVPCLRDYAGTLPGVVYAADNLFTCSQDTQKLLGEVIKEYRLNRVVVAACTPRTHETLFQETLREAGVNPYLFEMANIRDQDSWVHQSEPEKATEKAKDLLRMALARVSLLEPISRTRVELEQKALVIGGGVAGMNAALNLADQGFKTYLLEESDMLGGNAHKVKSTWRGENVEAYLSGLSAQVLNHRGIEVLRRSRIVNVTGSVGQYTSTVVVDGVRRDLTHGVVILAVGARATEPEEYLYGQSERVTRWHELEDLFAKEPHRLDESRAVAFIQCVGSRESEHPYCSKICCTAAIQDAISFKERKPDLRVYILYRDLRTYGLREYLYTKARQLGIIFIRYDLDGKPLVEEIPDGERESLRITVKDHVLGFPVRLNVDYLNLSTAIAPRENEELARLFKVPIDENGFFLEAHAKLRPVDFTTEGIFVCGLAHCPKPIDEAIAQAQAAASRAAILLARSFVEVEPVISVVNSECCTGCGLCEKSCSFSAIRLHELPAGGFVAETIPALCKGCGVCAAGCPQKAIDIIHFRDRQLIAAIQAGGTAA